MKSKNVRIAVVLIIVSFFISCGDLETLIPSRGSYSVRALVNGNAIEDCSIIRAEDIILPYFSVSVDNDPDLSGLLVYLLNFRGEIIGEKVEYAIDSEITPFPLPESMSIGIYKLVFEALGTEITLSHSEMDFFYIGTAKLELKDIAVFLPSINGSQLIQPGATVLLDAGLDFDSRLDPYLIWYHGKTVIEEGKISEGKGSILWTVPEEAGFYPVRLEVYPLRTMRKLTGLFREITLVISPKAASIGYYFSDAPKFEAINPLSAGTAYPEFFSFISAKIEELKSEGKAMSEALPAALPAALPSAKLAALPELPTPPLLLHWFQFAGNLDDSASKIENLIEHDEELTPRWMPAGQGYGLAAGAGESYSFSSKTFIQNSEEQGGGIFLMLIRPANDGKIFSASFPVRFSSREGVKLELIKNGYDITLNISSRDITASIPVFAASLDFNIPIPVVIEFFFNDNRFEAQLSLGKKAMLKSLPESIMLADALSGECTIKLDGGPAAEAAIKLETPFVPEIIQTWEDGEEILEYEIEDLQEITETANITEIIKNNDSIWCEFAVLYSAVPLFPEEFFPEEVLTEEILPEETLTEEEPKEDTKEAIVLENKQEKEAIASAAAPVVTETAVQTATEETVNTSASESPAVNANNAAGSTVKSTTGSPGASGSAAANDITDDETAPDNENTDSNVLKIIEKKDNDEKELIIDENGELPAIDDSKTNDPPLEKETPLTALAPLTTLNPEHGLYLPSGKRVS